METTRILWSGLTGKTGREAAVAARSMLDVEIVAGMKRNVAGADDCHLRGELFEGVDWLDYKTGMCGLYGLARLTERAEIDVIVDFSHPDIFERVLELAICTGKPLISGTSGLSSQQMAALYDATNHIPVFRGGNFRFKVKQFADEAIKFAEIHDDLVLMEQHWQGQPLPSEAAKMIGARIELAYGKRIQIVNGAHYDVNTLINEWILFGDNDTDTQISCKTIGFGELAHDVLQIAKVMAKKPVKKGELYDLDELWDDLASWVL